MFKTVFIITPSLLTAGLAGSGILGGILCPPVIQISMLHSLLASVLMLRNLMPF